MMVSSIEMWKEVFNIRANANVFERIKENLKKQNENIYQDWEQKGFDLNYTSDVKLNGVLYINAKLLNIVVLCGNLEIIKYLIDEKNADVQSQGGAVLSEAAENGYLDIVKYFIDEKNIDVQIWKGTALHNAAENGHLDIVKYTIEKGLSVNVQNGNGRVPLHQAAANGHLDIVTYLIEMKADINVKDGDGRVPLHQAAASGHLDIVKYLIEIGADINVKDEDGRAILHEAVLNGHLEIVKYLIEIGVDFNAQGRNGRTLLHLAAEQHHYVNIVLALMDANANVDLQDYRGNTPLRLATYLANEEMMQALIDANANVDLQDYRGNTPLRLVANIILHSYNRLLSIGKLLIAHEVKLKGFNAEKPGYLRHADSRLRKDLSIYWDKYLEIERMKEKKIDRGITLYDILICKGSELVYYARKGILQRALENDTYRNEFPIHANDLKDQYAKGTERLVLSNEIEHVCQKRQKLFLRKDEEKPDIITKLPIALLETVATHLENASTNNLKKALEINMQHQQ